LGSQTLTHSDAAPAEVKGAGFPFLDLKAQFANIREEVMASVERVMESQHFILGPEVEALEKEVAEYLGADFAIGCASGSDALLLSMMALGLNAGDEVITTPFTFGATAGSIVRLKARPVFVDIDPGTFNLDASHLEAAITPQTRALMPVHLFGLSADMNAVLGVAQRHRLPVIEDAAQAIGTRWRGHNVGTLGNLGCFSFFPSKNLGGAGDGGMITTMDPDLAKRIRVLRVHGAEQKYRYDLLGMNSRLDALQAAILRVKLRHLPEWTTARRRNAERYDALFREYQLAESVRLPHEGEGTFHVYNQYVVRAAERDQLQSYLCRQGIPTEVYYPGALHLQPAFSFLGYRPGDFPNSEAASRHALALPIFAELRPEQQRRVVEAIASFYQERR
jgi:dTDP-4-amino-4,6-dideoxygalactose transaminase